MRDLRRIKNLIEVYFGLDDLRKRCRKKNYIIARTIYVIISKKITKLSMTVIGDYVGLHHTSVVHMHNNIFDKWRTFPHLYKLELDALNTIMEDIADTDKLDLELEDAKDLLIQAYRAKNILREKEIAELERVITIRDNKIKYLEKYAPIL